MHPSHFHLRCGPRAAAAGRADVRISGIVHPALALLLATGLASMPAWSAEPPSDTGPRGLLTSLDQGEEVVAPGAPTRRVQGAATSRLQVTVRRGESLDAVIRRSLSEMPFKDAFLRQAVMDMNPAVFRAAATQRLAAGTVLQLPSLHDLCHMLDAAPAARSASAGSTPRAADPLRPGDQAAAVAADERKRWVRYP